MNPASGNRAGFFTVDSQYKNTMNAHIAICAISSLLLVACQDREDSPLEKSAGEAASPDRHIALEGESNFRDLGGYQTADGRSVKWGQVYRSGKLSKLSDADLERLEELKMRTVVSFLTDAEIKKNGPDRLPEGVKELPKPMEAGNLGALAEAANEAIKTGDFSEVSPEINPEIHRRLMDEGRVHYAALLREIIDPENRPLTFHCSHGVHRTGTAAAILLSTLGVPWETVREDYLLSNTYRRDKIDESLGKLKKLASKNQGIPLEKVDTTNMEAFYILEAHYIDAALDQAVKEYGSMDAYIREGLGMSDDEIDKLRKQLLED